MTLLAERLTGFLLAPIRAATGEEDRRRVRMLLLVVGYHVLLSGLATIGYWTRAGLPAPAAVQMAMSVGVLVLLYARRYRAAVGMLIAACIASTFLSVFFSDLTALLYAVVAFVPISVLVERRTRLLLALG
ncbi:MAG: hypothetical protein JNL42_06755, partial [Anaerolineae bacterium]|nr:hypothetical protein [Anaerolineae bacterium]